MQIFLRQNFMISSLMKLPQPSKLSSVMLSKVLLVYVCLAHQNFIAFHRFIPAGLKLFIYLFFHGGIISHHVYGILLSLSLKWEEDHSLTLRHDIYAANILML